jgi:hypothetical protein
MKRSLLLALVMTCSLFGAIKSFAQADTILPRIIYTNSDRTTIQAKTLGWNRVERLFKDTLSIHLRNVAILASTQDGNSLLVAAKGVYRDNQFSRDDSQYMVLRIDAPFYNKGYYIPNTTPPNLGGAKILKAISMEEAHSDLHFNAEKMLAIGCLSPDEKEWFFTPCKTSAGNGNQWFFHGKFDGTGSVDSMLISGSPEAREGYHMSNLDCTPTQDGMMMVTVIFDELKSVKPRGQVFTWIPAIPSGSVGVQAREITQLISALRNNKGTDVDSSFAFAFRIDQNSSPKLCQLALATNPKKADAYIYQFPATNTINSLGDPIATIFKTKMPKAADGVSPLGLFTGYTGEPSADDDHEVVNPGGGYPYGNGGDIMFDHDGTSLVFVTCSPGNTATAAESGIYVMNLSSGKVDSIINDRTKMERQPIFTKSAKHKYIPPEPPAYALGTATLDSTVLDFGGDTVGVKTSQSFFKLTANNGSLINITKAFFNGNNAGAFTLVSPDASQLPKQIKGHGTQSFIVRFNPPAVQTYNATLEIHYTDSLTALDGKSRPDSILMVSLTGIGYKKDVITGGGVHSSISSNFNLSIAPNPFTASTQITVTAREAGSVALEIRDLLGKEVYASNKLMLGANEKYQYMLDAQSLRLMPGTYFVVVRSGDDELTKQAIYIK